MARADGHGCEWCNMSAVTLHGVNLRLALHVLPDVPAFCGEAAWHEHAFDSTQHAECIAGTRS